MRSIRPLPRQLAVVVLLLTGCRHAAAQPPPVAEPDGKACHDPGAAAAEVARLEAENARAREKARARLGLAAVELVVEPHVVQGRGPHLPSPFREPWQVFVDERGRQLLPGDVHPYECHFQADIRAVFLRGEDGSVFRELDRPEVTRAIDVPVCACPPWPTTCGAYMPGTIQPVWVLPAGTTFRGDREIRYRARRVERTYHPPEPCPPPIFPPSAPR